MCTSRLQAISNAAYSFEAYYECVSLDSTQSKTFDYLELRRVLFPHTGFSPRRSRRALTAQHCCRCAPCRTAYTPPFACPHFLCSIFVHFRARIEPSEPKPYTLSRLPRVPPHQSTPWSPSPAVFVTWPCPATHPAVLIALPCWPVRRAGARSATGSLRRKPGRLASALRGLRAREHIRCACRTHSKCAQP